MYNVIINEHQKSQRNHVCKHTLQQVRTSLSTIVLGGHIGQQNRRSSKSAAALEFISFRFGSSKSENVQH